MTIHRTVIDHEHFLVVRNDRLGDAILALPVVTTLRNQYPESQISFLASPYTAPIIRCVDGLDNIIMADDRHCEAALAELITEKITTAICLRPTFSNARTLARAKIPVRIGTAYRYYSFYFTERIKIRRKGKTLHEADLNLSMLKKLTSSEIAEFPRFNIPDQVLADAESFFAKVHAADYNGIIVIHPGSGGSARDWPPEFYRELGTIFRNDGWQIIATGSAKERAKCSTIVGDTECNLAGATDIRALAAVLKRAGLVVAGSTGPLHLANALGRPVLGLYPPITDSLPSRWGPYLHPEMALAPKLPLCETCHTGNISKCWCMEQLTPEMVYERARVILDTRAISIAD